MDKYQHSQKDKLFKTDKTDPYLEAHRPGGSAQCPECGAKYHAGQWSWHADASHVSVENFVCPACRRIADRAVAGQVRLARAFLQKHREELVHLVRNTEAREKAEHALERLIDVTEDGDEVLVTTTGLHLANRIGHDLEAAYDGDTSYRYSDSEFYLSVDWRRD